MLSAVDKSARFYVFTAFLTTAMYHFATNEPQSYVLGGDSTLYIVTLDWRWNWILLLCHRPATSGSRERLSFQSARLIWLLLSLKYFSFPTTGHSKGSFILLCSDVCFQCAVRQQQLLELLQNRLAALGVPVGGDIINCAADLHGEGRSVFIKRSKLRFHDVLIRQRSPLSVRLRERCLFCS